MDANNRDRWFLDPGPLAPWIDKFAADLAAQRYTPLTIEGYTASARHFATWLGSAGIPMDAIVFAVLPNIGVGVPVGGNDKASHPTIGAAPSGSAPWSRDA